MPDDNRFSVKPPIGLIPKFVRDRERAIEIVDAMKRYLESGTKVPRKWVSELIDITDVFEAPNGSS